MRVVRVDGSPAAVKDLAAALADVLDGGPAVLPISADRPGCTPRLSPKPGTLVIETSGSTGVAKQVALSADALRASVAATHARLGGPGRWLLALPAHHIAGTQVIVRALLAGGFPTVLDLRRGFRPPEFATAADEMTADAGPYYTSLVPTQLHRVLVAGSAPLAALRRFDAVLVGGAATPPALLAQARDAGIRAITTYGMSETAGGCVYDGVPLDGVRVRLDEPDGRIRLAGPMLADGYLGDRELTATSFVGGWFGTSDLGRWDQGAEDMAGRRLQVLGRADDVIIIGGEKVHPAAVERVLITQPGVSAACVVGLDDPEWGQLVAAAVVPTDSAGPEPDELASAVRSALGVPSVPRLIRTVAELPWRGIGKPDRKTVAELLRLASGLTYS
ncbi:MAG: AMP-binding protein [Pseudonocardia sp.]|nr:AMP-binding protein [Pseudonocardia sp.]